jgi:hypothetical protein
VGDRRTRAVKGAGSLGLGAALVLVQLVSSASAQGLVAPPELLGEGASRAIAAADLDGDGDVDLVVGDGIAEVRVFENLGPGAFLEGATHQASGPRVLALGDLDGDRAPDLVVLDAFAPRVSVSLNDGRGHFTAPVIYRSVWNPNDVELVDLDGDRLRDLVIAGADDMLVLRNAGDGSFRRAQSIDPEICRFNQTVSLDADQDGDAELAVSGGYGVFSFQCCGAVRVLDQVAGTWTPGPALIDESCHEALAAGDLDGDGDVDLAAAYSEGFLSGQAVLLNDGSGAFSTGWTLSNLELPPRVLDVVDLDGDGDLDQVGETRAWINDGAASFSVGQSLVDTPWIHGSVFDQVLADVDQDGDEDIVLATSDGPVLLRSLAADGP